MASSKKKSKGKKKASKHLKKRTKKKLSKKKSSKKIIKKASKKKVSKKASKVKKKTPKKKTSKKKISKKKVSKKKVSKKKVSKKKSSKKIIKKASKKKVSKKATKAKKKVSKKKIAGKKVSKKKVSKKKSSKKKLSEKDILNIRDEVDQAFEEELVELKDALGNKLCCSKDCDQIATVMDKNGQHYCRLHYIALWESIQIRNNILTGDILKKFVDQIVKLYPEKFLEIVRKDLSTEKDFITALQDLDMSEFASFDDNFGYDSDEVSEDY